MSPLHLSSDPMIPKSTPKAERILARAIVSLWFRLLYDGKQPTHHKTSAESPSSRTRTSTPASFVQSGRFLGDSPNGLPYRVVFSNAACSSAGEPTPPRSMSPRGVPVGSTALGNPLRH